MCPALRVSDDDFSIPETLRLSMIFYDFLDSVQILVSFSQSKISFVLLSTTVQ